MTENPLLKMLIVVFWCIAMLWLLLTKMTTTADRLSLTHQDLLDDDAVQAKVARWRVLLNGEPLGSTELSARRRDDGGITVESELELSRIPTRELMAEFLHGGNLWGTDVALPNETAPMGAMTARSAIKIDADGLIDRWQLEVRLNEKFAPIYVSGQREGELMQLIVASADNFHPTERKEVFRTRVRFPQEAIVLDALAPHPRLANLRVGDRWKFTSFQAFPPSTAPRTSEAIVERTELVSWDGDIQSAFVVTFRDVSSHRVTATRGPYSTLWVSSDGTVIRQTLRLGNLELEFERVPTRIVELQTA